jgi:hypothetical protein
MDPSGSAGRDQHPSSVGFETVMGMFAHQAVTGDERTTLSERLANTPHVHLDRVDKIGYFGNACYDKLTAASMKSIAFHLRDENQVVDMYADKSDRTRLGALDGVMTGFENKRHDYAPPRYPGLVGENTGINRWEFHFWDFVPKTLEEWLQTRGFYPKNFPSHALSLDPRYFFMDRVGALGSNEEYFQNNTVTEHGILSCLTPVETPKDEPEDDWHFEQDGDKGEANDPPGPLPPGPNPTGPQPPAPNQ